MCDYHHYFFYDSMVAPLRGNRPMVGKENTSCPFCKGYEDELAFIYHEVWEEGKLFVRILANKYPIVSIQGTHRGKHDVIVDTDNHLEHPKDFSVKHWEILLLTMQRRWKELSKDNQYNFIQIFKNHGVLAGASMYHSHWQLVAMCEVPLGMRAQYEKYQRQNSCFLCKEECLNEGIVIKETLFWRLIVPPNPEFNYEVWLVPKRHRQHFGELEKKELVELGHLLKAVLTTYNHIMPNVDFNICMMSGDLKKQWHYHFYIRLMMRIGHIAGFEIATHCHILIENPEQYASKIRQLLHE